VAVSFIGGENQNALGKPHVIKAFLILFFSWISQRVIVGGVASDPAPVTSGVPQGIVLG
jgi:hypothetical protein